MAVNDPYGLMASGIPLDLAEQMRTVQGRQAIAEMLLKQSAEPIEAPQSKGRFQGPISPLQGIAKVAQAYLGAKGLNDASSQYADLSRKYAQGESDAAMRYERSRTAPAKVIAPDPQEAEQSADQGTPQVPSVGIPAGGSRTAVTNALMGPDRFYLQKNPMVLADLKKVEPNYHVTKQYDSSGREQTVAIDLNEITKPPVTIGASKAPTSREDQAAAVTVADITDPKNPTRSLKIDARTFSREAYLKGDNTGVLGESPKLGDIPKADLKLQLALPQARLHVDSVSQNLDRLGTAMNELHNDPGLTRITGTVMGRTPNLTNTATGSQAQLNMIKSNIFQSSLQAMREASKTGGAVGNVSDREGDKLERTLSALDQAQGTADFKTQLKKAVEQVRLSKQLIQNAFNEQYGGMNDRQGRPAIERRVNDEPPPGAVRPR